MFIKQIKKRNTKKGKTFYQYQLTRSARLNGKAKHISVLYLGSHALLGHKVNRKIAVRILEERINGQRSVGSEFHEQASGELLKLCDELYEKYQVKYPDGHPAIGGQPPHGPDALYEEVDIRSLLVRDAREVGAEWLCLHTAKRLGIPDLLSAKGWKQRQVELALISIVSRAVLAASEHKTADWLNKNSALLELFGADHPSVNRFQLYRSAYRLSQLKDELLGHLYEKAVDLFCLEDKIVIYDLTNTYFEGRKWSSHIARYGRSKEKRKDCKLVVMGAVVNQYGFLKASHIYEGNQSDPDTLKDIIKQMDGQLPGQKRTVVMDAGIATEENLQWLREQNTPYVCVSRKGLTDHQAIVEQGTVTITDKRKNKIELKIIDKQDEQWLYVKSHQKTKKEDPMKEKLHERLLEELRTAAQGIHKKGGTKKIEKVWERIGRIKERNTRAHRSYDIKVESEKGIATSITWTRVPSQEPSSQGVYFIRTNLPVKGETALWNIYNTIREVEATFRCLKTDLNLRPVFHQDDKYVIAHLNLGLIAYQLVATIRHQLTEKNINLAWRNIVRTMNTQKAVTVEQKAKTKTIAVRTCSQPIQEVSAIYKATNTPTNPFKTRKYVVYH